MDSFPLTWFVGNKISKVRWYQQQSYTVASPYRGIIATGTLDEESNSVALWMLDLPNQADVAEKDPVILATLPHRGDVCELKWLSHKEGYFLTCSSSGRVSLFNASGMEDALQGEAIVADPVQNIGLKESKSWDVHTAPCTSLDVHADINEIVSVGEDGTVAFLHVGDDQPRKICKNTDSSTITHVKYLSSSSVVTTNANGQLKIYDSKEQSTRPTQVIKDPLQEVALHSVSVHPSQPEYVAVGSNDGCLSIWDFRHTKWPVGRFRSHYSSVWEVAFHPISPSFVFTCASDGSALLWDFNATRDISKSFVAEENNIRVVELVRNSAPINSLDVNADLKAIICGTDNEALMVKTGL